MNQGTDFLVKTITDGRKSMPSFKKKLTGAEIYAMTEFIKAQSNK